jgi:hypothetical protein
MLADMGLAGVKKLLELEVPDYLSKFAPPMVDTYAFYGYVHVAGFAPLVPCRGVRMRGRG